MRSCSAEYNPALSSEPITRFAQQFPAARKAGLPCGVGRTNFDLVRDAQLAAPAVEGKEESIWSPFSNVDDWEFARWIVKTIGHNATQALLKLGIVSIITSCREREAQTHHSGPRRLNAQGLGSRTRIVSTASSMPCRLGQTGSVRR